MKKTMLSFFDNYQRDGGRENKNRTFEFLQPEGCNSSKVRCLGYLFIYIYIYIYIFVFCIDAFVKLSIYLSSYLFICVSTYLSVECIKADLSAAEDSSIYIYIYLQEKTLTDQGPAKHYSKASLCTAEESTNIFSGAVATSAPPMPAENEYRKANRTNLNEKGFS